MDGTYPDPIRIVVPGVPLPQGSMDAPVAGVVIHTKKEALARWRMTVAYAARAAGVRGFPVKHKAWRMDATYVFQRPKSVTPEKRPHMVVKPDVDKLERAILDALKGIVWEDDSNVIGGTKLKRYVSPGEGPHVELIITEVL